MKVSFVVYGEVKGKGRPRFRRTPYGVSTYTPKETQQYEKYVRECYDEQVGKKKLQGGLVAEIEACFGIPKSASKKKQGEMFRGEIKCTKKPDTDNIAKCLLDALNGVAYEDDKQVVILKVYKRYAVEPMTIVTLEEIEGVQG